MDKSFKTGFEKTALNVWNSGLDWAKHIAKKRAAHAAKRAAKTKVIQKSIGGTPSQAKKIITSPSTKAITGQKPSSVPSSRKLLKTRSEGLKKHIKDNNVSMNPNRLYRKEGIGSNISKK